MSKFQEYKCPKCSIWEIGDIIENNGIKCSNCGYIGTIKEFEAKRYHFYAQVIVVVIAFNEKDAKKEFELLKDDFVPYFDKLIKIVEAN